MIAILADMATDLTCREGYWDAPERKKAFMDYLVQVFDLDLSLWDKLGFWDDQYRPFSYFHNDVVVSNVCVYSMDMTVQGRRRRVAQLSAVGTLPEYRRRGLSRQLMQTAMDWASDTHDCFFLFADEHAYSFYKACGFRKVTEFKTRLSATGIPARPGINQIDMNEPHDIQLVYGIAEGRAPVSNMLGVCNAKLLMFWCLYGLRENVYHIPDLDILILYKRAGELVTIYDIVGPTVPTFADIYPYIADPGDTAVEFLFMTDKLQISNFEHLPVDGNGTHLHGSFPLESTPFILPFTAQA